MTIKISQSNLENDTRVTKTGWEKDLGLAHTWQGGGGTSRKCWHMINPVCALCLCTVYTHTQCEWHTSFFSLCWWCFFIFSTDRVSSPGLSEQRCTATQLPGSWEQSLGRTAYVTQTSVLCFEVEPVKCWLQEAVRGVKRQRMPGKPMQNSKLPSHCDAVPSIWKDTEATAGWRLKVTGK